jgi:hypothetical protein
MNKLSKFAKLLADENFIVETGFITIKSFLSTFDGNRTINSITDEEIKNTIRTQFKKK